MAAGRRLVFVGEAVLDVTVWVPMLPGRGADVLAEAAALRPGGGFNVMAAAARQGTAVLFAGRHGAGMSGDAVRAGLAAEGIEVLHEVDGSADTGFVVTLVQPDGERTFVTGPDAVRGIGAAALTAVPTVPGDLVYVSGYGLASGQGPDLAGWVASLGAGITVVADPGPLVAEVPRPLLDVVAARADWWSCNRQEASELTGIADPAAAGVRLAARTTGGIIVRDGAAGCVLVRPRSRRILAAERLAAPAVDAVDTTGAGDTHVGVFVAGLAAGRDPLDAARRATVAAAISVTRRGPATAPGRAELDDWMAQPGG